MIDESCPSVGDYGDFLADWHHISDKNRSDRLINFYDKYKATTEFLESIKTNLESIGTYAGYEILGCQKNDSEFLKMHTESLKFL